MASSLNPAKERLAKMQAAINKGGSVFYKRRLINRLQDLPTIADLAEGDPAAVEEAKTDLQAQIDDLNAKLAKLDQAPAVVTPEAPKTPATGGKKTPASQTPPKPEDTKPDGDSKPEDEKPDGQGEGDKNPDNTPAK